MHEYETYIESEMRNESISIPLVFTFHFFIFDSNNLNNLIPLHEATLTKKNSQTRHPRVGGDPVKSLIKMDSRLRGNDGNRDFLY